MSTSGITDVSNLAVSHVEALSTKGWSHLDTSKKEALLDDAKRERETIYSGQISRLPTLDGDAVIFVKNLAAHKYELASGGEAQSESSTGGSMTYNTVTGDRIEALSETRYGRVCLEHLRDNQQISIVRTR